MNDLKNIDHQALLAHLRSSLGNERNSLASFLRYLGEVDSRRLYAEEGQPSLFAFCTNALTLSEAESFARITAARLIRRFPVIHDHLRSGALSLTSLRLISAHLTEENADHIFANVVGRSSRDIEKMVATLANKRAIAQSASDTTAKIGISFPRSLFHDAQSASGSHEPPVLCHKPDRTRYVAAEHVEIRFVANEQLLAKIDRIKGLALSKNIGSRLEDVFDHVLESYLKHHDPARRAAKNRQSKREGPESKKSNSGRYIAQKIKDEVYKRDGGQCTFKASTGSRCPARVGLEFDHCRPVALGGNAANADDVRLLCRAHNRLAAERSFGAATVAAAIARQSQKAKNIGFR